MKWEFDPKCTGKGNGVDFPLRPTAGFLFTLRCTLWGVWPHQHQCKSQKSIELFWLFTCRSEALGPGRTEQYQAVVTWHRHKGNGDPTSQHKKINGAASLTYFWKCSQCSSKTQAKTWIKLCITTLNTRKTVGTCKSLYSMEVEFIHREPENSINTSNDRQDETICSRMTQQYIHPL